MKASQEPLANEQECEAWAAAAYKYCISLYGPPDDAERPYNLTKGINEVSGCSRLLNRYTITLSPGLETREQQCMLIGHEMYHRFTMHQEGLRRQPWIDEMLAFLTSLWFLRQQGFSSYADLNVDSLHSMTGKIDLVALRAFLRPGLYQRLRSLNTGCPENFYSDLERIAIALELIIDGDDLRRIINAATLEEWIASLPLEKQYGVCRLLEVTSDGKKAPESAHDLYQFCNALAAKGDQAMVISEVIEITRLQPINGSAFFNLGRAYQWAMEFHAAQASYLKALELGFCNDRLCYYLGTAYWHQHEFASSARWFQQAIELNTTWASAHYYFADSLNNLGSIIAARQAWEKVLTLDDEHYAKLAQKAMEENPLLDGAAQESGKPAL